MNVFNSNRYESQGVCLMLQLYPLYVIQTLGKYQGVPGLVLASVFSGALR